MDSPGARRLEAAANLRKDAASMAAEEEGGSGGGGEGAPSPWTMGASSYRGRGLGFRRRDKGEKRATR